MNHNLKGTIVAVGEGTMHREMQEALRDAESAGINVTFATEGRTASACYVKLHMRPHLPELPPIKRSNRKTPNQPWYARFRKDKR